MKENIITDMTYKYNYEIMEIDNSNVDFDFLNHTFFLFSRAQDKHLMETFRNLSRKIITLQKPTLTSSTPLAVLRSAAELPSVSSTVLTVLVELPSTRPSDDAADLAGLANFFFSRKRILDLVCLGVSSCRRRWEEKGVGVYQNKHNRPVVLTALFIQVL